MNNYRFVIITIISLTLGYMSARIKRFSNENELLKNKIENEYKRKLLEYEEQLRRSSRERIVYLDSITGLLRSYKSLDSLTRTKDKSLKALKQKYLNYGTKSTQELENIMEDRYERGNK